MKVHWQSEKEAIDEIRTLKEQLEQLNLDVEREPDLTRRPRFGTARSRASEAESTMPPADSMRSRATMSC